MAELKALYLLVPSPSCVLTETWCSPGHWVQLLSNSTSGTLELWNHQEITEPISASVSLPVNWSQMAPRLLLR